MTSQPLERCGSQTSYPGSLANEKRCSLDTVQSSTTSVVTDVWIRILDIQAMLYRNELEEATQFIDALVCEMWELAKCEKCCVVHQ